MTAHPVAAGGQGADREAREVLIGDATRDVEQVLSELLFGVGLDQHVLRRVVHAAQVARVRGVATAPGARRGFEQQHARQSLDGPRTFSGRAVKDGIEFERDGQTETVRASNGEQTGMKWLAEKKDCLRVKSGEGYCKN